MKQALLYEKEDTIVTCKLCAHNCRLKEGRVGVCGVRKNINGELYSLNYDKVCATHADPIEKKPLYHFLPATTSYSVATMGCNFKCRFCQNDSLSVVETEAGIYGEAISPEELVRKALRYNSESIAYTYSEPTIYFELMLETAKLAKQEGIKNIMVTNGYMSREAFEMIAPWLDGANIDLKAFSEDFYKELCSARLAPVLDTIKVMKAHGIWVELTTLLIPGLNTDAGEIKELISFILSVDANIPWHVSRFFPHHRLQDVSPTPTSSIYDALHMGREMGLQFVYAGNVGGEQFAHTRCPACDTVLIKRSGYSTQILNLSNGTCSHCNQPIPGVWNRE
jgi:pyruvate formate lyase activating enzyme